MNSIYGTGGLFPSFIPNVYINKVTLEGKKNSSKIINANSTNNMSLHINEKTISGGTFQGINSDTLRISFDLFVEVPDLGQSLGLYDQFVSNLDESPLFEAIKVSIITFKNGPGKKMYLKLLKGSSNNAAGHSVESMFSLLETSPDLDQEPDRKRIRFPVDK
jgi:hypothetical protein